MILTEMKLKSIQIVTEILKNIYFSPSMISVLRYGEYDTDDILTGSFIDLDISLTQFVIGFISFYIPTNSNIVSVSKFSFDFNILLLLSHYFDTLFCILQIIGDNTTAKGILFDEFQLVGVWAPLPFTEYSLYYVTGSLYAGLHYLYSNGFYTVSVMGSNNGAGYGFIPAFNSGFIFFFLIRTLSH